LVSDVPVDVTDCVEVELPLTVVEEVVLVEVDVVDGREVDDEVDVMTMVLVDSGLAGPPRYVSAADTVELSETVAQ
jgi:hypothetical protein